MAERYETKAPVRFTRDGTVTLQQDQRAIYEEMSSKKDPQQTEESTYTNLQLREKQPTSSSSSSSSSNGGAQVGVVRGKTSTKVIVAVAIVFTACVILVAFALIMAGMTLSSSQETSKDSTRSSALIESLESQLTQLQGDLQDSTQQSTRSSALIESLNGQVTELRQELSSMRSTLAVAQHSFNTSLHILLHPYQNCYTDTTERRMTSTTTTYYTRRVATNYLNINVTVTVSHISTLELQMYVLCTFAGLLHTGYPLPLSD